MNGQFHHPRGFVSLYTALLANSTHDGHHLPELETHLKVGLHVVSGVEYYYIS